MSPFFQQSRNPRKRLIHSSYSIIRRGLNKKEHFYDAPAFRTHSTRALFHSLRLLLPPSTQPNVIDESRLSRMCLLNLLFTFSSSPSLHSSSVTLLQSRRDLALKERFKSLPFQRISNFSLECRGSWKEGDEESCIHMFNAFDLCDFVFI